MLAQLTDVVRIDASLLVDGGTALDDSVQITLRLVIETSVRQDAGDGRLIPNGRGYSPVDGFHHTACSG